MGLDIWAVVEEFRKKRKTLKSLNNTNIMLIPKKVDLTSFVVLWLISLCNMIYWIISKVISNRLKLILSKLISPKKSIFIHGRQISSGIIISHEVLHLIKKYILRGMLIKLDLRKTHDRVQWNLLMKCLEMFGFKMDWMNLVFECISSTRYSIVINETACGFFDGERGQRQGDPLSPFLFALMVDFVRIRIHDGVARCI